MNLAGIIAISGKPGLYKVIAQGKNTIIVESIEDKKRVPAYATDRISALDDISIYTYDDDKPLREIFTDIFKKENGGATISHKEDAKKMHAYLLDILPNFDQDRVYPSDIKKLFQWYNLLHKAGELKLEEEAPKAEKAAAKKEAKPKAEKAEKTEKAVKEKAPAKKAAAPKKAAEKSAPKATAAKKVAAPKTGASRGK
ncbi:MAG: DUF5606 domain-containing protein [Fluviicola sp.]|jgi:hypothetical protein